MTTIYAIIETMYYVTTASQRQRALWRHLFSADCLPVREPFPHEVFCANGRSKWVYVLDSRRLHPMAVHRLAAYIQARTRGMTFAQALAEVRHGWTINAERCKLVTTEGEELSPALFDGVTGGGLMAAAG